MASKQDAKPVRVSDVRAGSPLLLMFTAALLFVVAMLVWLTATPTWFMVGVAVVAMLAMTGWVLFAIQRLLDA